MMINDLQNLCFLNIINSLVFLIMIYQNYLFLVHVKEISSGNGSHTFSPLIDNRECTMAVLDHNILDIICEIFSIKSYQIIFFHHIIYRNTLVDHAGNCVGIIWRRDNDDLSLLSFLYYLLTYLNTHSYNNAAYIQLYCL